MRKPFRILVLNPDTGSTQIGIYENEKCLIEETICHEADELCRFPRLMDQYDFRRQAVLESLNEKGINLTKFSSIVGRGGLLEPVPSGTYRINERMLEDLRSARYGDHVYNLGAVIAHQIAIPLNIPAFVVDPLNVDEMQKLARISRFLQLERKSPFHALNPEETELEALAKGGLRVLRREEAAKDYPPQAEPKRQF